MSGPGRELLPEFRLHRADKGDDALSLELMIIDGDQILAKGYAADNAVGSGFNGDDGAPGLFDNVCDGMRISFQIEFVFCAHVFSFDPFWCLHISRTGRWRRKESKPKVALLQPLRPFYLCQATVERAKWQMTRLSCKLQHQTVGKSQRWFCAEKIECRSNYIGILYCQAFMAEQHLKARGKLNVAESVNGSEDPHCFRERQDRDPRILLDESTAEGLA